jgi:hypothetical protein
MCQINNNNDIVRKRVVKRLSFVNDMFLTTNRLTTTQKFSRQLFVYQDQEVHLFGPSLSFLAEAQPRLETGEDKSHFLAEVHINSFRRPHKLQSKRHH